jgi:hypothetical protein
MREFGLDDPIRESEPLQGKRGGIMASAIGTDLQTTSSEVVSQRRYGPNRHDPDGVAPSLHQTCHDIHRSERPGKVNGAKAVWQLWADPTAEFPDVHIDGRPQRHADDGVSVEVTLTDTLYR